MKIEDLKKQLEAKMLAYGQALDAGDIEQPEYDRAAFSSAKLLATADFDAILAGSRITTNPKHQAAMRKAATQGILGLRNVQSLADVVALDYLKDRPESISPPKAGNVPLNKAG